MECTASENRGRTQYVNGVHRATVAALPPPDALFRPAVLLVESPNGSPSTVGDTFGFLTNDPGLHSDILWAAGQGPRDWRLPNIAPGRALYAFSRRSSCESEARRATRQRHPPDGDGGARLRIDIEVTAPAQARCLNVYLLLNNRSVTVPITLFRDAGRHVSTFVRRRRAGSRTAAGWDQ